MQNYNFYVAKLQSIITTMIDVIIAWYKGDNERTALF